MLKLDNKKTHDWGKDSKEYQASSNGRTFSSDGLLPDWNDISSVTDSELPSIGELASFTDHQRVTVSEKCELSTKQKREIIILLPNKGENSFKNE